MTAEQLKWTDKQWASHMQWDVRGIPALRKRMTENYFPSIVQKNGLFVFRITKLEITSSGEKCELPFVLSDKAFESSERATQYANQEILPRMEIPTAYAKNIGVPKRALQMLHIHENQK